VGKTHLARTLGDLLFSNNDFKQFDMSEFSESHSISKLIGSPPGYVGYGEGGKLTEYVRHNPYCVLLFDEIEKAHPDALQIFLQLLEYGTLTDSDGLEVNFKNTIIIMTSNVGAYKFEKLPTVGFGSSDATISDSVIEELKKTYPPEFINRIDEIIVFDKLSTSSLYKITKNLLLDVKRILKSNNKTTLHIDNSVSQFLVDRYIDDGYGARPIRRLITKYIETPLADYIIKHKLVSVKKIHICIVKDKVTFSH